MQVDVFGPAFRGVVGPEHSATDLIKMATGESPARNGAVGLGRGAGCILIDPADGARIILNDAIRLYPGQTLLGVSSGPGATTLDWRDNNALHRAAILMGEEGRPVRGARISNLVLTSNSVRYLVGVRIFGDECVLEHVRFSAFFSSVEVVAGADNELRRVQARAPRRPVRILGDALRTTVIGCSLDAVGGNPNAALRDEGTDSRIVRCRLTRDRVRPRRAEGANADVAVFLDGLRAAFIGNRVEGENASAFVATTPRCKDATLVGNQYGALEPMPRAERGDPLYHPVVVLDLGARTRLRDQARAGTAPTDLSVENLVLNGSFDRWNQIPSGWVQSDLNVSQDRRAFRAVAEGQPGAAVPARSFISRTQHPVRSSAFDSDAQASVVQALSTSSRDRFDRETDVSGGQHALWMGALPDPRRKDFSLFQRVASVPSVHRHLSLSAYVKAHVFRRFIPGASPDPVDFARIGLRIGQGPLWWSRPHPAHGAWELLVLPVDLGTTGTGPFRVEVHVGLRCRRFPIEACFDRVMLVHGQTVPRFAECLLREDGGPIDGLRVQAGAYDEVIVALPEAPAGVFATTPGLAIVAHDLDLDEDIFVLLTDSAPRTALFLDLRLNGQPLFPSGPRPLAAELAASDGRLIRVTPDILPIHAKRLAAGDVLSLHPTSPGESGIQVRLRGHRRTL